MDTLEHTGRDFSCDCVVANAVAFRACPRHTARVTGISWNLVKFENGPAAVTGNETATPLP